MVGLLISLTTPFVYLGLDLKDEQDRYGRQAQAFAEKIQLAIDENPEFWKLNVEKFIEVFEEVGGNMEISRIEVYDSDMRLLHAKIIKNKPLLELPGKAPIYFNDSTGYIMVIGSPVKTLSEFAILLAFFCAVGLLLSVSLYRYSVRTSKQYELETNLLLEKLVATNKLFAVLNHELESEITERKKIETSLKRSEEELTTKNNQLAAALEDIQQAQARLIQQEKLAAIGQLAAGVAHEINNPLGFITGNIEALEQYFKAFAFVLERYRGLRTDLADYNEPRMASQLDQIIQLEKEQDLDYILADIPDVFKDTGDGLARMSKIIKGMRLFSRVDQQQVFEPYDLNQGLENTLLVARNEIKHSASVQENYGQIPLIEAIGGEINQVLLNLVLNAVQAIREKHREQKGEIMLSSWTDGKFVFFSIADNGAGITVENLNNIFNPFFTTKPVGQGTGMGLSISYEIVVNHHQGDIQVESGLDEGTTFIVKLPIKHDMLETIKKNAV
jgi:signal transduction histidine kinase